MIGPVSAPSTVRSVLDPGPLKGADEARLADEFDRGPIAEAEDSEGSAVADRWLTAADGVVNDRPDPQLADMILGLMPFDRSTLDGIVDRFLDPLDGLGDPLSISNGYLGLLASSMGLAVAVVAADVALRIRRSRGEEGDGNPVDFPGLPGFGGGSIA